MDRIYRLIVFVSVLLIWSDVSADTVQLLDHETSAFQSRLTLIDSAVSSIDVACYSVQDDEYSRRFLERLRTAARRGIRVRVIVDALFNGIPRGMQRHLSQEGIQIREFHQPGCIRRNSFVSRMHDKVLLTDRCSAVLGGRNISEDYFGRTGDKRYIDLDVLVSGSVVGHMATYFDWLWNSCHVRRVSKYSIRPAIVVSDLCGSFLSLCTNPDHFFAGSASKSLDQCALTGDPGCADSGAFDVCETVTVPAECLSFLHADLDAGCHGRAISEQIAGIISCARRRVVIETPYLVLWDRMEHALELVVRRGVHVTILTNSIDSTDNLIVNAELTNQKHRLERLGVDLREYHGQGILHAKTMVVDDTSIIGSFNLNPRSEYYDTETAVVIKNPIVATHLLNSISLRHRQSRPAIPHQTLTDFVVPPEKSAPLKYVSIQILRLVTPLIHRHL